MPECPNALGNWALWHTGTWVLRHSDTWPLVALLFGSDQEMKIIIDSSLLSVLNKMTIVWVSKVIVHKLFRKYAITSFYRFISIKLRASFSRSEGQNSFPSSYIEHIKTLVIIMRLNYLEIEWKEFIKRTYSILFEKLTYHYFTYSNYSHLVQDTKKETIYNHFHVLKIIIS